MNQTPGEALAGELPTWRWTAAAVVVGEEGTVQTARGRSIYFLARGTRGVLTNICGVNDGARTQYMTSVQPAAYKHLNSFHVPTTPSRVNGSSRRVEINDNMGGSGGSLGHVTANRPHSSSVRAQTVLSENRGTTTTNPKRPNSGPSHLFFCPRLRPTPPAISAHSAPTVRSLRPRASHSTSPSLRLLICKTGEPLLAGRGQRDKSRFVCTGKRAASLKRRPREGEC